MKGKILILSMICLFSLFFGVVSAGDAVNTICGDGICDSPFETEENCCMDCGVCDDVVVETKMEIVVETKETGPLKNDVIVVNTNEQGQAGSVDNVVVKTADGSDNSLKKVEVKENKIGFFKRIISFFRSFFADENGVITQEEAGLDKTKANGNITSESGNKCPDGICDDLEMKNKWCPEDCQGIEGWGEVAEILDTSPAETGLVPAGSVCGDGVCDPDEKANNTCCEDCNEDGCGDSMGVNLENCGDGVCDNYYETAANCPQDCGVKTVSPEDEFKENYNQIMKEMKDIIPAAADKEKMLDISSFYTPSATCYFSAGASLVNYLEKRGYDEFVWYGRPLNFQYDTRWNTLRTGVGGGELTFESFHNLGYKAYVGRTNKMYLPTPERLHLQASKNFIFFETKEESLEFIKKLLSADIPVMINLQAGTTPDYLFIKGYDETHIYIPPYVDSYGNYIFPDNMPSFDGSAIEDKETQNLTYAKFFSLWEKTGNTFYWIVKESEAKNESEMLGINKKDAEEAYGKVQQFIKISKFETHTSGEDIMIATSAASRYLTNQGYTDAGKKYLEIASLFNQKRAQWETVSLYSQVASIYKAAEGLW